MYYSKIGGLRFLRLGSFQVSWCCSSKPSKLPHVLCESTREFWAVNAPLVCVCASSLAFLLLALTIR